MRAASSRSTSDPAALMALAFASCFAAISAICWGAGVDIYYCRKYFRESWSHSYSWNRTREPAASSNEAEPARDVDGRAGVRAAGCGRVFVRCLVALWPLGPCSGDTAAIFPSRAKPNSANSPYPYPGADHRLRERLAKSTC